MKTFQELIEDLKRDPALVESFNKEIAAKAQAGGEADPCKVMAAVAAEQGYAVRPEEIEALATAQQEKMSEEELGKVAGGTLVVEDVHVVGDPSPITPYTPTISILSGQCRK